MPFSKPLANRAVDRRRDFRVVLNLRLRLRAGAPHAGDNDGDLVSQYELLGRAAQRYRKEASPNGRQFVDRIMSVLDLLTAASAAQATDAGWSPRVVVESNLSASGVGFIGTTEYHHGAIVAVEFALPPEYTAVPFRCEARVVRCLRLGSSRFDVGLEFDAMSSVTRERLIRVLFDVQRRSLRDRSNGA